MEGKNAVPSQHQAPKSQGCFFLSSQLHSLFSKQYLLQNHKLGDRSDVESIFITVGEDLGVKNSQIYWVAEHSPDPPRPFFPFPQLVPAAPRGSLHVFLELT